MKQSTQKDFVKVDMSYPEFVKELGRVTVTQLQEVMDSITKIQALTWRELLDHSTKGRGKTGFNYEFIDDYPAHGNIHSIRITKDFRARVSRSNQWMRFISLHPDHDIAY